MYDEPYLRVCGGAFGEFVCCTSNQLSKFKLKIKIKKI